MKKLIVIGTILLSFVGLNSSDVWAAEPKTNIITAYLTNPARTMEATLFYDGTILASIAIHGSVQDNIRWRVEEQYLSCTNFEKSIPHLYVTGNGKHLDVVRMTCESSGD